MAACPMCAVPATGGFFANLFSTDFVPRAQCVGDRPEIIWPHIAADAAIALAYYSIPLALAYFVKRRRDVAFGWMFMLFAAFILACGTTHLFNILAFWYPMYRLDAVVKGATGGISIITAIALWPLIPRAVALPSPSHLRAVNQRLEEEIEVRRATEMRLEESRAGLEASVQERTRELAAANEALSARIAELESVYESAPVGLGLIDSTSRLVRTNSRLAELLDLGPGSPGAQPLSEISQTLARVVDEQLAAGHKPGGESVVQVPAGRDAGHTNVWLVAVRGIRDGSERLMGASIAVKDMTERTRLQQQLHQSQKMEAVGQLASGIAHDINNTLTAIYGYLSLALVSLHKDHEATPYLEKIAIAAEQASQTTRSLLTFARPVAPRRDPIELAPVVQQAVSMARGVMPARIQLAMDIEAGEGLWVQGDSTQIQQVLLNLAINARDSISGSGRITVSLGREGETARMMVVDSGSGMTPEVVARIFEPFFTTKPRGEGTGLGLAVVQGIVTAHNGKVMVESTPGAGTVFSVMMPLIVPPGSRPADAQPAPPGLGAGTVMLLEDNVHVRDLLSMALRTAGFSVIEVGDGREFLAQAQREPRQAAAYVLDIDIPGCLGTECLDTLRSAGDRTPAVFISGGRADDVVADEITRVLAKPFHASDLIRALNSVIAATRDAGGR
jgi:signal transduction histidine kinase/CheY-like chemotaxis protein